MQGENLRDFWEFDPATRAWTQLLPWFSSPNHAEAVRSSPDSLSHRDAWGSAAIALDPVDSVRHTVKGSEWVSEGV